MVVNVIGGEGSLTASVMGVGTMELLAAGRQDLSPTSLTVGKRKIHWNQTIA